MARLGVAPFLDPPEGIHAQIAWEMLRGGGWITPHLNGVPYFDKPPLPYWLMAGRMVAANLEAFLFGRMVKPDMLFVACLLLGLYGFILAYLGGGSASALLRLNRRVQIVNGRQSNLAFGSTFPEARPIFWPTAALSAAWTGDRRVFLLSASAPATSVVRELPASPIHLLVDAGGRRLYSNRR